MKYIALYGISVLLLFVSWKGFDKGQVKELDLRGAWQNGPEENLMVWINSGKHFAASVYNTKENKFIGTCGGTWRLDGNTLIEVHEFNTIDPELIGKEIRNTVRMDGEKLVINVNKKDESWTRLDDTTPGKLDGAWVITGRVSNGELRERTPGARKTMKILSGTRFQWIAYNSETKEFFGTGGGAYTSEGGKYVENIEFFSRDNSRVGMKLEFDFSIEDGKWHHKGFSSKGDPIHEVWSTREMLGI